MISLHVRRPTQVTSSFIQSYNILLLVLDSSLDWRLSNTISITNVIVILIVIVLVLVLVVVSKSHLVNLVSQWLTNKWYW